MTNAEYCYRFPRPALTVDCAVFGIDLDEEELRVLLIERDEKPFEGRWALPGGFVRPTEGLEVAARRELAEETGLRGVFLEQLYTFGDDVARDPRERVITVAYYALVKFSDYKLIAATDAREAAWFSISDVPELAFDHAHVLEVALRRLQGKVTYEPLGFELLPEKFSLTQLQRLYGIVLERPLDKRNFRKKILRTGVLADTGELERGVAHRAARLYRFDRDAYRALREKGFMFEI